MPAVSYDESKRKSLRDQRRASGSPGYARDGFAVPDHTPHIIAACVVPTLSSVP